MSSLRTAARAESEVLPGGVARHDVVAEAVVRKRLKRKSGTEEGADDERPEAAGDGEFGSGRNGGEEGSSSFS